MKLTIALVLLCLWTIGCGGAPTGIEGAPTPQPMPQVDAGDAGTPDPTPAPDAGNAPDTGSQPDAAPTPMADACIPAPKGAQCGYTDDGCGQKTFHGFCPPTSLCEDGLCITFGSLGCFPVPNLQQCRAGAAPDSPCVMLVDQTGNPGDYPQAYYQCKSVKDLPSDLCTPSAIAGDYSATCCAIAGCPVVR